MTTLYGIKNCDTVVEARKWLDKNEISYEFHDLSNDGVPDKALDEWVKSIGWETLLNRRSTTWRKLPDHQKVNLDADKAKGIMQQQPTIIKRPVIEHATKCHAGFSDAFYKHLFQL